MKNYSRHGVGLLPAEVKVMQGGDFQGPTTRLAASPCVLSADLRERGEPA